jgi:hypothetical protein
MISPLYGQLSPLRVPANVRQVADADALAYIASVQTADGQSLEDSVKFAYEDFIVGCKADGIWNAIKASCILAGARTLSGALAPLVGSAPTNFNFVGGDYNRKTGLKGNRANKHLNSNRNVNTLPQNSVHLYTYSTEQWTFPTTTANSSIGAPSDGSNMFLYQGNTGNTFIRLNAGGLGIAIRPQHLGGFGASRNGDIINWLLEGSGTTYTGSGTLGATSLANANIAFFRGGSSFWSNARVSFYSIGENIAINQLNSRIKTLMNDLAAAIP